MTLHADLLVQAEFLAKRKERNRPKQASLRRAISAAYYALFHLLVDEASRMLVKDRQLVNCINRKYDHREMKKVSKEFTKNNWPQSFNPARGNFSIPRRLVAVAQAFIDLQQARHDADYDLAAKFSRSDAMNFVERSKKAFDDWESVKKDDVARIYLACFLNWDELNKPLR